MTLRGLGSSVEPYYFRHTIKAGDAQELLLFTATPAFNYPSTSFSITSVSFYPNLYARCLIGGWSLVSKRIASALAGLLRSRLSMQKTSANSNNNCKTTLFSSVFNSGFIISVAFIASLKRHVRSSRDSSSPHGLRWCY